MKISKIKFYGLFLLFALLSCKKEDAAAEDRPVRTEDQCFILNTGINFDDAKRNFVAPTHDEILSNFPSHIKMTDLTDYKEFSYDQQKADSLMIDEKNYYASTEYQEKFGEWILALPEFKYLSQTKDHALAKNKYGLWLIEKKKEDFKPYFIGLSQNIYLPKLYGKDPEFIVDGQFVMSGTLVDVQRLSRVPMRPKYEVIKDGVQFSIDLADIKKDTDKDGFNDLFEIFIGLNPESADTDGDGISDFVDSNPKFKSGKDKFTLMYNMLVDQGTTSSKYSFIEILTDCAYFQAIEPQSMKVLVYNTTERVPLKEDVMDQFFPRKYSKMKTYKNYPEVYFTDFSDETGDGTISAEFVEGKWKFDKKYTVTFGM